MQNKLLASPVVIHSQLGADSNSQISPALNVFGLEYVLGMISSVLVIYQF
jgi:hypothetical protein